MVIMASSIACGHVRMTATMATESCNVAAILQIKWVDRDMQPWFTVYFFDIGYPCYDQLTPVKTRYLLTSFTWPYRRLKFVAHRDQVFFEVDHWPSAGFSIGSQAHVWLTRWKQGTIVALFCIWWLLKLKNRRQNNIQKTSAQRTLQNSNQNSTFSWVIFSLGSEQPGPGAMLLGSIF